MEEIRSVQKYLDEIFAEIERELAEEEFIRKLVGSEEKVRELIESQRELIRLYIESWESESVDFSEKFEELYTRMDIPYTVISWNIERIKSKIMEKLIDEGYSSEFILRMKSYLEDLINQIAKIYLRKDVKILKNFKDSPFENKLLYKIHEGWFLKIAECIEKDDFSEFPLMSASECAFSEALEYPESLFVCLDVNMCTYVHNLHELIHDTANTFYTFYTKGLYYQAYRVFKDFTELVAKLLKTVSELYFLAYSDTESNFFKLAQAISSLGGTKYVTLIDIIGLGAINRTYGEEAGNLILREVEKRLRRVIANGEARTFLVRGTTANFFMLNLNFSQEETNSLVERISQALRFDYKFGEQSIPVNVAIATLEVEPYVELSENELRDILSYLKQEAKEALTHTSSAMGKERRLEIISRINEKYRNISRIKGMVERGEVEVALHPIVSAANPKVLEGVEVLARLRDREKLVPAGVFIDLIHELDLIERLDTLVLKKLLEHKKALAHANSVYINMSSRSLKSKSYMETLCGFVREFKDKKVVIELTEQQLLEDTEAVLRISKNGHVAVAVDDFGTGYSSLRLVADLADKGILKVLKIDGSLVQKVLESHATWKVVDIISALSKRLEVKTVAEFIEDEERLKVVRSMGIDFAQGYYIAKPMTVSDFLVWAKRLL